MRTNPFYEIYKKPYNKNCPNLIDIELTNKCNLSCSFCSRNIMSREQGFMSSNTFNHILEEVIKLKIPVRFIRWGEPFLHPKIFTYANKLTKKGIQLHITTNGLLLDEEKCNKIIASNLDSIIFSMQGLTRDDYESQRKGSYTLLESNIELLNNIRGDNEKPFIHITCTSDDIKEKERNSFLDKWSNYADKITIGRTNWARLDGIIPNHAEYQMCREVYQKLSIDWDGKVTACCGDYDNLLTIGNINKQSLESIWRGDNLKYIRGLLDNMKHRSLTLCSKCYPAYGKL